MKTKILLALAFIAVLFVSCQKTYTCIDENGIQTEVRGSSAEEACGK